MTPLVANPVPKPDHTRLKPVTHPFSGFEWSIALAYLKPVTRSGFVSVFSLISFLGFFIGVMVLVIVIAVMNGFRSELFDRILGIQGHGEARSIIRNNVNLAAVIPRIKASPDVIRAVPLIREEALISFEGARAFGVIQGIEAPDLQAIDIIGTRLVEGQLETFGDEDGVAIGIKLARALGVFVGQSLAVTTASGVETAFGSLPRTTSHKVLAIYDTGFVDADQYLVMMPMPKAQAVTNKINQVDFIEFFVKDPDKITRTITDLGTRLPPDIILSSWENKLGHWRSALDLERRVMFLILSMIILVAMLNILGTLAMMVMVKTKTIAVLRTIGMTRGAVMRIFMITGTMVGVAGTAMGFSAGLVIAYNLGPIENFFKAWGIELLPANYFNLGAIPSEVRFEDNMLILLLAFGLSVAGTLYPSWRAGRIEPVEALRYE